MADKRKWTLFIGALMAVGIANFGCSDEDAVFLPEGDLNSAAEDCKSANTCTTADACQSGVGAIACKCVTDNDYCHSDVRCNGVGSCSYVCSPNAGTCSYAGCASDPACSGPGPGPSTCDIDNLSPNEDFDKDGIPNGKELNSRISVNNEIKSLDPCKPDTDGDGIFDGDEDLNHNGIFESWLGETNPVDINDPEDADTEVGRNKSSVKKLVCNSDNLRDSILLKSYRVAKVRNDIKSPRKTASLPTPRATRTNPRAKRGGCGVTARWSRRIRSCGCGRALRGGSSSPTCRPIWSFWGLRPRGAARWG